MNKITHIKKTADGRYSATQEGAVIDGKRYPSIEVSPMIEDHVTAWLTLRGVCTDYSFRRRLRHLDPSEVLTVELEY